MDEDGNTKIYPISCDNRINVRNESKNICTKKTIIISAERNIQLHFTVYRISIIYLQ